MANGEPVLLPEGSGLLDLFDALGVGSKWVVAEINGAPVDRGEMATATLNEGDRIELVRAVAGG